MPIDMVNIVARDLVECCCICVDEFENAPVDELLIYTECMHLFHEKCLR